MAHGSEAENSYTGWFFSGSEVRGKGLEPLAAACGQVLFAWRRATTHCGEVLLRGWTSGWIVATIRGSAVRVFECLWPELVWGLET